MKLALICIHLKGIKQTAKNKQLDANKFMYGKLQLYPSALRNNKKIVFEYNLDLTLAFSESTTTDITIANLCNSLNIYIIYIYTIYN